MVSWPNGKKLHSMEIQQPNETHICCDMNLNVLNDKWLRSDYHLLSLSKLVQAACNLGNFFQLVHQPTRIQYNSVKKTTDISCIDHLYTNQSSDAQLQWLPLLVTAIMISLAMSGSPRILQHQKEQSERDPTRRSTTNKFLAELTDVDWTEVYENGDVDEATEIFARKSRFVLNNHAPWIVYQARKHFCPWLTEKTKKLMEERDKLKQAAVGLALAGDEHAAGEAWDTFKQVRNQVNNRKKYEEIVFKKEKIAERPDSTPNT